MDENDLEGKKQKCNVERYRIILVNMVEIESSQCRSRRERMTKVMMVVLVEVQKREKPLLKVVLSLEDDEA